MSESANSSSVSIIPEFVAAKFQQPSWHVRVNSIIVPDAILEKVDLGFGSDISSASFFLPVNPLIPGSTPIQDDIVEIIVNNKTIFRGPIRVISDHIGNDGLKISYTAFSDIVDLNKTAIINGAFNSDNADYRDVFYNLPSIFSILRIPCNPPNVYPGEVNVTDQTPLTAAESLLNKVGNYKLYYDMVNQILSIYEFQKGGLNTRSFLPGKNIINYDINKSIENTVGQVTVVGPPMQVTYQRSLASAQDMNILLSPSGRYELSFILSGRNIRDISVEGQTREKPDITYDMSRKINKAMIKKYQNGGVISSIKAEIERVMADMALTAGDSTETNDDAKLSPRVVSHHTNFTDWNQVPTQVVPRSRDSVTVYISECPKIWTTYFINADIPNSVFGLPEPDVTSNIEIVDAQGFTVGAMRVTFTVDEGKPAVQTGSGGIQRTITDSQYQIVNNLVTGENNAPRILFSMQTRADAEYARLNYPKISGTITILGDETVDLRQTVLLEGLLLDIVHITHNFTNGHTTNVTLTNERFVPSFILRPLSRTNPSNLESEKEKRKGLLIYTVKSDILRQNRLAHSEKKKNEELPNGGDYTVLK